MPPPLDARSAAMAETIRRCAAAAPHLTAELLLFARCQYALTPRGFADATPADVAAFLEPARGLDVYDRRQAMLAALAAVAPNPALAAPPQAGRPSARRRWRLLRRRRYRAEVARRCAPLRAAISPAAAVRAERASTGLYAILDAAFGGGDDAFVPEYFPPVVEAVARRLDGAAAPRIADLATGAGTLPRLLRRRLPSARVVMTDLVRAPGRVLADVAALPLPGGAFDAVTATGLLEMLTDPATLAREIRRLLRPGGAFAVVTTNRAASFLDRNPLSYLEGLAGTLWPGVLPPLPGVMEPLTPLPMPHAAFTPDEVLALFRDGFADLAWSTTGFVHVRRLGLGGLAPRLPLLRRFGGHIVVHGRRA